MNPMACLARTAMAAAILVASAASATELLIDFDHHRDGRDLDVTSGQVVLDGVVLPYLAEFGLSVTERSRPGIEMRIANLTQTAEPSLDNMFHAFAPARPEPYSYRLAFDQPVDNLSFVRVGLVAAFASHDAWTISAFDSQGSLLGQVSEPQVSQFGNSPEAAMRGFSMPYRGIASLLVLGNLSAGGQTFESPAIDDLRFSLAPVPEPQAWATLALGLACIVWRAGRQTARAGARS